MSISGTIDGELLAAVSEVQSRLESTRSTVEESQHFDARTFRGRRIDVPRMLHYLTLTPTRRAADFAATQRATVVVSASCETGGDESRTDIRF